MICLGEGGCLRPRRLCGKRNCTIRIHDYCYFQWYCSGNYSGCCPCSSPINTYRFGLPPNTPFQAPSEIGEGVVGGEVGAVETRCYRYYHRFITYLAFSVYLLTWVLVLGYLGKVIILLFHHHPHWDIYSQGGLLYHWIGIIISTMVVLVLRVIYICGSSIYPTRPKCRVNVENGPRGNPEV